MHFIVGGEDVAKTVKEMKSYTALAIIRQLEQDKRAWLLNQLAYFRKRYKTRSTHQVWQEGSHPKPVLHNDMMHQKMAYIHNNPVKAGFVAKPEHWLYSSAANYITGAGVFAVDLFEF